jgi:hypothetical protein
MVGANDADIISLLETISIVSETCFHASHLALQSLVLTVQCVTPLLQLFTLLSILYDIVRLALGLLLLIEAL